MYSICIVNSSKYRNDDHEKTGKKSFWGEIPGMRESLEYLRVSSTSCSCLCSFCVPCYGQGDSILSQFSFLPDILLFYTHTVSLASSYVYVCMNKYFCLCSNLSNFISRSRKRHWNNIQCYALPAISFSLCIAHLALFLFILLNVMKYNIMVGLWYNGIGILLQHFMTQYSFNLRLIPWWWNSFLYEWILLE